MKKTSNSHSKTAKDAPKTVLIQIAVSLDEHKSLKNAAAADGRSLRQFVKWSSLKASGFVSC